MHGALPPLPQIFQNVVCNYSDKFTLPFLHGEELKEFLYMFFFHCGGCAWGFIRQINLGVACILLPLNNNVLNYCSKI
jgi:hypothetical protein